MASLPVSKTHLPPQVGQSTNITSLMLDVLVALLPALGMSVFFFGFRVLVLSAISVASCVLSETLFRRLTHQKQTAGDLSACVTGLLLAMCLPASSSYWVPVLGGVFAIIVVKQFYGGLGKNFINPALAGRMLLSTFPVLMTTWTKPMDRLPVWQIDAVTAATPMSYLHEGLLPPHTLDQLFLGYQGGSMGEVSSFMLLLGGLYLILRQVISPRIPLSYLGSVALLTLLFPKGDQGALLWMVTELLSGGLILGAFFLATDPTTSPVTPRGQLLFGAGCGLLTVLLRYHSSYPEGVGWAILTMNCCVWLLDRAGLPRRFGVPRFSATKQWLFAFVEDVSEIKFVRPTFRSHEDGKAPGEKFLDPLRAHVKPAGILALVILTTGAVVAGVQQLTDLDTARAETHTQREMLALIMPKASFSSETPYWASGALSITAGYSSENELVGHCVEVQTQGFGGVITMVVGVDLDGKVTGVTVTDHHENSGVGTKALSPSALARYVGRFGTIRTTGTNAVDTVSGATATSKAITAGVNRALEIVANLNTEGGGINYVEGEV